MFLSSEERRLAVSATSLQAAARCLGQGWPKASTQPAAKVNPPEQVKWTLPK
jgi:hypothetical protein